MKLLYIFFIFASVTSLIACGDTEQFSSDDDKLRYVRTLTLDSSNRNITRELPGVVAANRAADLSFRIAGKVLSVDVREGDTVQAGQKLATLDATDIRIRLKSDQATYDRALADFNRGKALVGNGTISQADYNQLQSSLASAEAALESTKQNLIYSVLDAPFDGVIAKRDIENFEEIQAKQVVFVIQDVTSIDIKVDVPESIMIVSGENRAPDVVALFDAIPGRTFPLTMKEIAFQADTETNTYEVTMTMPSVPGYTILPGMSVTARAKTPSEVTSKLTNSIFVPAHAVLEDNNGRYVFIAQSQDQQNAIIERRSVVSGQLSSLGLEIVSGLNHGDELVIAGMSKMYDGLQVKIAKVD